MYQQKQRNKLSLTIILVSGFLILAAGIWLTLWTGKQTENNLREELLTRVEEIARAVNPLLVKQLEFKASDSATPEYQRIRQQMIAYGRLISQRGIYSMALREGKIYFGPETYNPGDPLASPAGTMYLKPSKEDFEIFSKARPVVMGPNEDEYGNFYSALAPVIEPLSGSVLMVIGVDVHASAWEQDLLRARLIPAVSTAAMLIIIITGYISIFRRNRLNLYEKGHYRYLESYLVAIVGIFLSVLLSITGRDYEEKAHQNLFRLRSYSGVSSLRNEFAKIEEDLSLLGDYFVSSQQVDPEEFSTFTGPLIEHSSGVNFMWVPEIPKQERSHFEISEQKRGVTGFIIHACNRDGYSHEVSINDFYYPVQYVQPPVLNRFMPGFDLSSDPEYRKTIEMARHNNLVMCAEAEPKMRQGTMQTIILAISPVSKESKITGAAHPQSVKQSEGCACALISISSLIENALRYNQEVNSEIDILLVDLMSRDGPLLMGSNSVNTAYKGGERLERMFFRNNPLQQVTPLFVFGRAFAIIAQPNSEYLRQHAVRMWWMIGVVTLGLTFIMVLFVRSQQNLQVRLRDKVNERTEELKKAKDKAEESDRLKSALLLNLSHELRNPLNGILGFGGILSEKIQEHEQKKMAGSIVQLGNRLLTTFTSMLKLSQLEAENKAPSLEVCNAGKLLKQLIADFKERAKVKRLGIKEVIDDCVLLRTDREMLHDILFFFLDNAIKFTEAGYVWVSLQHEKKDGIRQIVFSIKDSGIGIGEDQMSLIFKAFRQGSEGIGRSHEGPGLGLTICKRYADLLGAEINVESTVGTGSTFTLTFRTDEEFLTEVTAEAETAIPNNRITTGTSGTGQKHLRILVVEDNQPNADLILTYLGRKFQTDIASSGKLAIKYAYQNDYDIVLMDINLGADMDGIQATHTIRGMKNYARLPVIAVTGYSTEREREHILNQGLTDFISKPFTREQLLEVMGKYIRVT